MINNITDTLKFNMMNYSAYLIQNRILPAVEDGMKPVHRRVLWAMREMGATKFTKSANVTGEVMKIHPHGSTYSTIVNMTQIDNQNVPLLVGKGNFAQHTSKELKPASERYTEVKLSPIALDILSGAKNDMVDFVPNYDNTRQIPKYLPTKFPNILAYATSGIGVGISTTIPSYNIKELCEATKKYINTGEKQILYPDFACGGLIVEDKKQFENIIMTGKGTIKLRGKCYIEGNNIIITEIPYSTTREDIVEKIISLAKDGKFKEVNDVKDLTGSKGMKIKISCKRGTDMDIVKEKLYRLTSMESTFNTLMNVLTDGNPKLLGFYDIVEDWYKFRKNCIKKYMLANIDKLQQELHLLEGLKKVLLDIDKAIEIIRNTTYDPEVPMSAYFKIDIQQSQYVCNMKLRNINKDYIIRQIKDIETKYKELELLQKNVKNEEHLKSEVIKGIDESSSKFATERKTQLIQLTNVEIEKTIERKIIEDYDVTLYLTKDGYFKKVRYQRGENKLKSNDKVMYELTCNNKDEVAFFGADKNCYKFRLHELEDNNLNTLGRYMPTEIGCEVKGMTVVSEDVKAVVLVYKDRVAKINIDCYKTTANRKQLKNSLYDELVYCYTIYNEGKIKLKTKKGKEKLVITTDLTMKSTRNSQGIKMLNKDEFII